MQHILVALMLLGIATCACAQGGGRPASPAADPVSFPALGEAAPILEGVLSLPPRPSARISVPAVVLCHPNPVMGGTMNDPVLRALEEHLLDLGIAVLRFNFRGVGASTGEHTEGEAEVDDVLGAVAFLRAQPVISDGRVAVAGYSFGSQMTLKALARDEAIIAGACLGFPTGHELVRAGDFPHLAEVRQPLLFVTGTEDQWSSVDNISALCQHYDLQASILPLDNTTHFFRDAGVRGTMAQQVAQFLSIQLLGEL